MSTANMPTSFDSASKSGHRAEIRLIEGVHYRREAFAEGFRKLGFEISFQSRHVPREGDVLVLWNRYRHSEMRAREYEASGATVLIAENAWLGPEEKDKHWFALAVGHHNGAGAWRCGGPERWADMNIDLKPWRRSGSHVVVLPQRGMGELGVAQPEGWLRRTLDRLDGCRRDVVVHYHPGPRPHPEIDWRGVWCAVTWASGAALKALVAGVPVFYELPHWVGATAAIRGFDFLENPFLGDRLPMFNQLAWAMWRAEEIATGEPLAWLLCKSPYTSIENSGLASMSAPLWRRGSKGLEIAPA